MCLFASLSLLYCDLLSLFFLFLPFLSQRLCFSFLHSAYTTHPSNLLSPHVSLSVSVVYMQFSVFSSHLESQCSIYCSDNALLGDGLDYAKCLCVKMWCFWARHNTAVWEGCHLHPFPLFFYISLYHIFFSKIEKAIKLFIFAVFIYFCGLSKCLLDTKQLCWKLGSYYGNKPFSEK